MGGHDRARLQTAIGAYFDMREAAFRIRCVPEQRSRISSNRYRIPDICLLDAAAPKEQVVETLSVLCIEILFPEDSLQNLQVRVDD